MTAKIIPFPVPSLIERVARRMLPVMEAPPGDQRDEVFGHATVELGAGRAGGLDLTSNQWKAVWRRVDEIMSAKEKARG